MSKFSIKPKASWKQWLHFLTGDRKKESEALSDSVLGGKPDPSGRVKAAADELVRAASGDDGIQATRKVEGDIATPADVASQLDPATSDTSDGKRSSTGD